MHTILKTDLNITKIKLADYLDMPEVVRLWGLFEDTVFKEFCQSFERAENSLQPYIPIIINSYGGLVDSLFGIIDVVDNAKKPVVTICEGKAMSAGAVLLTCGKEGFRFGGQHSLIMMHEVSKSVEGKVSELEAYIRESNRINKLLLERASTNCGKDKKYFEEQFKDMRNIDMMLNAEKAKGHNIINHIGLPELRMDIPVKISLHFSGRELDFLEPIEVPIIKSKKGKRKKIAKKI